MSMVDHAWREFQAAGWCDKNKVFDDRMQEAVCKDVIALLDLFASQGHSGSSAPYAMHLFEQLASFKPVAPLTGEPWEWNHVGTDPEDGNIYQNNRCSTVFKNDKWCYNIEGIVFYDVLADEDGNEFKSYFTCKGSRVAVTFPYTPTTVYKERDSG